MDETKRAESLTQVEENSSSVVEPNAQQTTNSGSKDNGDIHPSQETVASTEQNAQQESEINSFQSKLQGPVPLNELYEQSAVPRMTEFGRRNFRNQTNWKKSHSRRKDVRNENLSDPNSWPSLGNTAKNSEDNSETPLPPNESEATKDASSTESQKDLNKKKVNWVPLKDIGPPPRLHSSGRRARRGPTPMARNWKSNNRRQKPEMGSRPGRGIPNVLVPFPGFVAPLPEGETLREAILYQIEYYFSVENLCKDLFLRGQMDNEGWISLETLCNFNRVRALGADPSMMVEVLKDSTLLEVGEFRVRRKEDWKTWLLPTSELERIKAEMALREGEEEGEDNSEETEQVNIPISPTPLAVAPNSVWGKGNPLKSDKQAQLNKDPKAGATTATKVGEAKAKDGKDQKAERKSKETKGKEKGAKDDPKSKGDAKTTETSEKSEWQTATGKRRGNKTSKRVNENPSVRNLAEELELSFDDTFEEAAAPKKHDAVDYDDDDDDEDYADLDDEYVSKLIIVTQSPAKHDRSHTKHHRKSMTDDLYSAINDGLYFYEQNLSSFALGTTPPKVSTIPVSPSKVKSPQRLYPGKEGVDTEVSVGWIIGRATPTPSPSSSYEEPKAFPTFHHPSHSLLDENGFIQHKYHKFRARSLKERKALGIGLTFVFESLTVKENRKR